jgi:hypothetical protein
MKPFVTRVCAKVSRFFWSWGFLKFVLLAVTLIVLLYAEENWRGARAWATTKAYWEAKGETFDINRLAPPPVPDDENLAALPIFKMEPDPDPGDKGNPVPLALRRAFTYDTDQDFPRGGSWELGKLADEKKNRADVAAMYAKVFGAAATGKDSLTQFDELFPAIAKLRDTAAARRYCRFEQFYSFDTPYNFSLLTSQIMVSKFISADAILALEGKKPDIVLGDIETNFKLAAGVDNEPLLVAGLVAVGMAAIDLPEVYEGLSTHVWNDAQLADLQSDLARMDFVAGYQRAFRGETCLTIASFDRLKPNRKELASEVHPGPVTNPPTKEYDFSPLVWPDGWIDLLKARSTNFDLTVAGLADVQKRTISPDAVNKFETEVEGNIQRVGDVFSPWAILSGVAVGPVNNAAQKFAIGQARIDEARIACGLERYRLAHGVYPETLAGLAPAYIDEVPNDVINGQPYHYRLNEDGTFLLYSVGWNQTDDGGKFAFRKDNPKAIDYEQGDWVWPTPKKVASK